MALSIKDNGKKASSKVEAFSTSATAIAMRESGQTVNSMEEVLYVSLVSQLKHFGKMGN